MEVKLLKAESFVSKNWGGGLTTELFCYPASASYKERNFDFRLSTATVEVETSTFTPLEGIARTLMILDGEMTLAHENHHTKTLKKFEFDCFDGGWKTTSVGKCNDFNLMTRGNTTGELEGVRLDKFEQKEFMFEEKQQRAFLYLVKGAANIYFNGKVHECAMGDLLIMKNTNNCKFQMEGTLNSELVLTAIV